MDAVEASHHATPLEGGCGCRQVRYRLRGKPLFTHCCHCRWCQRESGAAFALNALIESERLELLAGQPLLVHTPSASGQGQPIARCPRCQVALWSHYAGSGPVTSFIRVGTLDEPDRCPPDVHVFTSSRQPWVRLAPVAEGGAPAFEVFYRRDELWPAESLQRWAALQPAVKAWRARQAQQAQN